MTCQTVGLGSSSDFCNSEMVLKMLKRHACSDDLNMAEGPSVETKSPRAPWGLAPHCAASSVSLQKYFTHVGKGTHYFSTKEASPASGLMFSQGDKNVKMFLC